jgi:hypothetical protein
VIPIDRQFDGLGKEPGFVEQCPQPELPIVHALKKTDPHHPRAYKLSSSAMIWAAVDGVFTR